VYVPRHESERHVYVYYRDPYCGAGGRIQHYNGRTSPHFTVDLWCSSDVFFALSSIPAIIVYRRDSSTAGLLSDYCRPTIAYQVYRYFCIHTLTIPTIGTTVASSTTVLNIIGNFSKFLEAPRDI